MTEGWAIKNKRFGNMFVAVAYPPEGKRIVSGTSLGWSNDQCVVANVNGDLLSQGIRDAVLEDI